MFYEVIHLRKEFPQLEKMSNDPTLCVYLPDNLAEMGRQEQKHPCMLICPGGAYEFCSKREEEPVAFQFLPEGYNVFVLDYSVAPYRFPTQLCEVAAAMELIYKNAEIWHCDTSRIAIMGFSAGGHLAAHYTNAYAWPEVRAVFPESKKVNASVLCYPVISADPRVAHLGSFHNLLGHENLSAEDVERFSCQNQVTEQTPPTFLWHTAPDDCVPVANSLLYAQSLAAHGNKFALHIYPEGWHGMATVDAQTNDPMPSDVRHAHDWLDAVKKWLSIVFAEEKK